MKELVNYFKAGRYLLLLNIKLILEKWKYNSKVINYLET